MPTDTATTFAPTAADMEAVHYGVALSTFGEDGDMLALGHFEARRALAAFNCHARTFIGLANVIDDRRAEADGLLNSIRHGWGQFRRPGPDEDPDFVWVMDDCQATDDHATPYTRLHVA